MTQENTTETPPAPAEGIRRQRKARRRREEPDLLPTGRGTRHLLPESLRHMQELFELLPRLKLDANGDPDPQATDDAVLKGLAVHAQASAAAINLGMSAVGSLMAYAAPECEDKAISSDAIEALGWLLAELGATTALMIRLAERLKQARSRAEYQRIQCVLIRATLGSSAAEIARLLGWSTATVHVMHSRWAKEGDAIFELRGRGGRRRQHMSPEQERQLLAPFVERAQAGGMLTVSEIQQAYQEQMGKTVAASTIYRLLDRHGWRKVVPRPRHPKADVAAQAAFKKTPQHGTPRGRAPG